MARIVGAVVDVRLAIFSGKSGWTRTSVIGRSDVEARAAVCAGRDPAGVDLHVAVDAVEAVRTLADVA